MLKRLRAVREWGIKPDTSADAANYIRMTNTLLMFLTVGSVFETAACFLSGAYQAGILNSSAPLVFGGGLLLMRTGRTLLARLLVMTIAYLAGYALATIFGRDAEIQLLILFGAALGFTFFPLEQWKYILYALVLPLVCFMALELTHYEPVFGLSRAGLSGPRILLVRVTSVTIIWLLVLGQFAYHIRARGRSQERLISSAKMVAIGHMAAGIAHEVNNPLFLIVNHADRLAKLAEAGAVPVAQAKVISDQIQTISMKIGAIVHGLQALSRDASGDPFVEMPLQSLLYMTLDYCRARFTAQGVEIRIADIPETWTVIGREAQLSEVLLNLLNNALDATRNEEERWIEIVVEVDQAMVQIAVTDSGGGIRPELRAKIFDPFFTTKPIGEGTGLGLSISRGIMMAHQGRLIYDEDHPRTRFVMRVPRGRDVKPSSLPV